MARSIPARVKPSVLRWARRTIDLTEVAASRKIGVDEERLAAWESGDESPTIVQLRKASEVYKRPLAVFFLAEPPTDFDTLRDFRRLDGADKGVWSPALHDEFRRAHEQRETLLELAEIDDVEPAADWRINPIPEADDAIASAGRDRLLAVGPLSLPVTGDKPYDHLNTWVAALEASGVLVMATSGGRVPIHEMRAFSLYFDSIPVIVVNGADSPRGRLFSLLHEYAHL
ncbi:XRE family transcriptional regulator, partial [Isoptericola hypogeus]